MYNSNEGISAARFLDVLESAEVKPVFKKKSRIYEENYRPISILPVIYKTFERLIFEQLIVFFEPVFFKYQCAFWRDHSEQHCLLVMIEKWKKCLYRIGKCGALLTDFPKAFDCFPHPLLIAKLHAYGFHKTCTEYLKHYLSYLIQKIKINSTYSNWTNISNGASQGSIGSTTFQYLSCNFFLFIPKLTQ